MEGHSSKFQHQEINAELEDDIILTIAVPAYNASQFLARTLDPFLELDADFQHYLEVIIVNDGSTDNTGAIADEYVQKCPQLFRAVHKTNGGHGSGVNYGIEHGKGMYYYVLDADDWLDVEALEKVLTRLLDMRTDYLCGISEHIPDLFLVDYTYENIEKGRSRMRLNKQVPVEKFFKFSETKQFGLTTYLTMHSMIYRMDILHQCKLKLPEHCFYVDNLLAYIPLPYCEYFYYYPKELYHYEVGRDDQSVNERNLIKRIDQQLKITRILTEAYHLYTDLDAEQEQLRNYLLHYLAAMYTVSTVHLLLINTAEAKAKKQALWNDLKAYDAQMFKKVKHTTANFCLNLPLDNKLLIAGYRLVKGLLKFN